MYLQPKNKQRKKTPSTLSAISLIFILALTVTLYAVDDARAAVSKKVLASITVPATPIDSSASADGRFLFVLAADHKVYIYSNDKTLKGVLAVEGNVDSITASANGEQIFVTDKESRTIKILAIEFIQTINAQGAPFKGNADAPITIAVFSDFQCPYCAKIIPLLDEVLTQYPKDVKVIFKNFPLRMHKEARPAAAAAWAAKQQDKFWEMHDLIFADFRNLNSNKYKEFAEKIGLDQERFEKDLRNKNANLAIQKDLIEGAKAGVRGTPTIFINGRRVKNKSSAAIKNMIQEELQKQ